MSSWEITLNEMRHAFDTAYASVVKYENKTIMSFGAEIAVLLFYISNDEMVRIRSLFSIGGGWFIFAILAGIAFVVAAVLFIITLAVDRHWFIPPDPAKLLYENRYAALAPDEVGKELIDEYSQAIVGCTRKTHAMKVLSDIGIYFLVAGVVCLLVIKLFGV